MILLIETQLFPPVETFRLAMASGQWYIEAQENFNKGSYRNKYEIMGANGPILLTVPLVKGKHRNQHIGDVRISYTENWQSQHIRTLQSCYGKSPYFEEYFPSLKNILETHYEFLWDLNNKGLEVIGKLIGFSIPISHTEKYIFPQNVDPAITSDYRDELKVNGGWKNSNPPSYPQLFMEKHGFVPRLSIVDLLFCTGPEAILYLK